MARFSGKVAIVTGSSNGIGRATAVLLASEGAQVTITGRDSARLEETRQAILKEGVPEANVNAIVVDVTSPDVSNKSVFMWESISNFM
ncbi:hypothetical protein CAEBREN_28764 [Caenorhabditis brenneri]|uniref:Uncharacterized protein n=1 Tax=Caenorhabditis brenneri TaxID=135651 RepID=G0PGX2_CAEBE|nr:hypothetical protein CAEBREN_28764 [Caenorhabditis brenneri]